MLSYCCQGDADHSQRPGQGPRVQCRRIRRSVPRAGWRRSRPLATSD